MARKPDTPCAGCGKPMWSGTGSLPPGRAMCRPCRRQRVRPSRNLPQRRCAWCAVKYTPMRSRGGITLHCSKSCSMRRQADARQGAFVNRRSDPEHRRTRYLAKSRARQLRRALTWDGITDQEILDRDRWICGICRKKIGKTYRYPHPRSRSVDHVIPLSEGGDDTAVNKRAAHLGCNVRRGARGGGEQIALLSGLGDGPCISVLVEGTVRRARASAVCECGARKRAGRCWTCFPSQARPRIDPDKAKQAAVMRAEGVKWQDITDALGFSQAGNAYNYAKRYGDPAIVATWPRGTENGHNSLMG